MSDTDSLIPISPAMLTFRGSLGIDVYWKHEGLERPILYCAADVQVDPSQHDGSISQHAAKLFIDKSDGKAYQKFLRSNCDDLLSDKESNLYDRAYVIGEVVRDALNEEFTNGATESIVNSSQLMGGKICDLVRDESLVLSELVQVLHHDYATFTHSTNVSLFCVLLARELGYSEQDVERIAVGGLLHDLGKLNIDDKILTKPGRLDEFEFDIIKLHPTTGFRRLVEREDLCDGQLMMVYQHHEKQNGSGYPVGCIAEEIHPWAQLCTVVDVYEALIANRPYRRPMTKATALSILHKGSGTEFSAELVECWSGIVNRIA